MTVAILAYQSYPHPYKSYVARNYFVQKSIIIYQAFQFYDLMKLLLFYSLSYIDALYNYKYINLNYDFY